VDPGYFTAIMQNLNASGLKLTQLSRFRDRTFHFCAENKGSSVSISLFDKSFFRILKAKQVNQNFLCS